MNILVRLSPELRGWITHNLERGCVPGDLVSTMVGQQFEPPIAQGLVDAFVRARTAGVDPPDDSVTLDVPAPQYEYETPRLPPGRAIVTTDRTIPVLMRAEQPVLAVLEGVLSPDECDEVIALARPRLQPSTVVDPQTGVNTVADYRDSEGMFFERCENPVIATLDRRIAQLMNCPLENGEGLQVLRYGQGSRSTPHFDFLVPSNAANVASVQRSGQRISSLVVYLNEVELGGETVFPEAGLSVTVRKGNAVYFEYSNSRGQLDHQSLHAGAPVLAGEKWAMTKWMRARRFVAGS
jgi:prolyl 4-hydroxylase